MPETNEGVFGEAAPESSPDETTGAEDQKTQDTHESDTDVQDHDAGGQEQQHVPYERFQQVNESYRSTQAELEAVRAEIAQLRGQGQQNTQQETPEFQTTDDLIQHMDGRTKQMLERELSANNQQWESKMEAQNKIVELNERFPEMKDPQFKGMLVARLQQNPGMDHIKAAQDTKNYLKSFEDKGRESAKNEFIQKGSFQGGVEGNQPLQQSDEDKKYIDQIVNAGGNQANSVF